MTATHQREWCDVSEQKRAEALLCASTKQWETTFDAIRDGICVLDMSDRIVRCNQAMADILEVPRESLAGRGCCQVFCCGENHGSRCLISQIRESWQRVTGMVRLRERWFAVAADPVRDEKNALAGAIYIVSDVTEILESRQAREVAEHELGARRVLNAAADRLRTLGEMVTMIAHELNQPLVGVRGLAEHLLIGMERGWDIPPEKQRERLTLIMEQADRMAKIIERVRMFAREAGKPEVHSVQLNQVVQSAVEMVGEHLRVQGIALECELTEALPPVSANPFSLEEVVLNLITNARDAVLEKIGATPAPFARILVRTFPCSRGETRWGVVQVIDEGSGIPREILPKVFEPFFTTKPPNQGTGIGLMVCKHIVEQFGGTIEIESEPGLGTTVTFAFPVGTHDERKP
ncbi:MAG: ATP-binding protein [Planctomycetota bacterium]